MSKSAVPNMNYAWSHLTVRALMRLGADGFFVAPGSRSSPLAWTVAELAGENMVVHFDERGLAFMALGHARATGKPAVIITTSGSAVANLFPAVCEAAMDEVPLIILSADRPPELRNCGANQAMDQINFFGTYARWFVDLPCPKAGISPRTLIAALNKAVRLATLGHPGPVHLNQMFREPLHPETQRDGATAWLKKATAMLMRERSFTFPSAVMRQGRLDDVVSLVASAKRGIVVAGAARNVDESRAMRQVANTLGWPLLPDIRSGLRLGEWHEQVIHMADQVLLKKTTSLQPDVVLHMGGRVTSKRIMHLMRQGIVAHVSASILPVDPDHAVRKRLVMALDEFAAALPSRTRTPASWLATWTRRNEAVAAAWKSLAVQSAGLTEPAVAAMASHSVGSSDALYLASSMPVRDMDMYGLAGGADVVVVANRGVSGIDGTIASAIGFARGSGKPVTLITGDLALLHDMNSLALVRHAGVPVRIILLNNNGGGIFSFLPVASAPRHFEKVFGTPHQLGNFHDVAAQFSLGYVRPSTRADFVHAWRRKGHMLIEVQTGRDENLRIHRKIQKELGSVL